MKEYIGQLKRECSAVASDFIWRWFRERPECGITTWQQFAKKVATPEAKLLARMGDFRNPVLVSGCQRSGTTVLARIIGESKGMTGLRHGRDDELYHALVLAGAEPFTPSDRYCLQTTYLNNRYREYLDHDDFHLVWLIRKPESVIFSMQYRWRRWGLNDLYESCGKPYLEQRPKVRKLVELPPDRLTKACLAYCGKVSQILFLKAERPRSVTVVDYDQMVSEPSVVLPELYEQIGLEFQPEYVNGVHSRSTNLSDRFPVSVLAFIERVCAPIYREALLLVNDEWRG